MQTIILAAGKGTRFNSEKPKVLHQLLGKPMLEYVLNLAENLQASSNIVVIGYKGELVQQYFNNRAGLQFVWQQQQLGTGHAVMMTVPNLNHEEEILILYGDVPGLRTATLQDLYSIHKQDKNTVTILTANISAPGSYGRIIRDTRGRVVGIREAKDCTSEELKITEVNSGIMIVKGGFLLSALPQLKPNNIQKEYYLTDIVDIANKQKLSIGAMMVADSTEIKGVNCWEELEEMEKVLEKRSTH